MSLRMSRRQYADLYGPTTGDRVRLADTDLIVDRARLHRARRRGEVRRRQGDPRRHGPVARATRADGAPDLVITNAIIVDHTGIYKADVGIRDGRIVGIGKAGNPDIMDGVTPGPGDRRVHRDPRRRGQDPHRRRHRHARPLHLAQPDSRRPFHSGITTLIGGGTGPATGTNATTCTPGAWNIRRMLRGRGGLPAELRLPRQGQRLAARAAARADRGRRHRPEAARGLGHDARGHRLRVWRSPTSSTSRSRSTPTR